jgi:crotonobetainyl-CoA:carnitine CoA-transferase CaiB-like acyl-CoA transferase
MPGKGDDSLAFPLSINDESVSFTIMNWNKNGITLNLKVESGKLEPHPTSAFWHLIRSY